MLKGRKLSATHRTISALFNTVNIGLLIFKNIHTESLSLYVLSVSM